MNSQGNMMSINSHNRPHSPSNHRIDPKILTLEDDNKSNRVNFDHTMK